MRWPATPCALGAAFGLLVTVVACGGGGGSAGAVQPPAPSRQNGITAFTFTVPASFPSARSRHPLYVSPGTRSMSVDVVYATIPRITTIANFAAGVPGCSSTPSGLSCTVIVGTQDGAQTFVLTAFDAQNGAGNALSTATIPVPPMTGQQTDVAVTLDGIVKTVSFSVQGSFTPGVAASLPLLVNAKDAAGAIIVSPGSYVVPIALQNSDTSGTFTLSTARVDAPGTTVTLSYNGAPSSGTTIAASAGTASLGSASVGFGATPGPTPTATPLPTPTATPALTPSPVPTATFPVTIHTVRVKR